MKEQYVADINDYRKYALLRALAKAGGFKLGICWMMTPNDEGPDGRKISYLLHPELWRERDPELFDLLKSIVNLSDGSRLRRIEEGDAIPGAVFHNEELQNAAAPRRQYMESVWRHFLETDIIFFDPDNGIEIESKPKGRKDSAKYIYWDEIGVTYQAGHSILVYQHYPFQQRDSFIVRRCKEIEIHGGISPSAVWVLRTPHVAFFLLAQSAHVDRIIFALQNLPNQPDADWLSKSKFTLGKHTQLRESQMTVTNCRCCEKKTPIVGARVCPECQYVFRGKGWDGIDAHWRSKHEKVMSYADFWQSLCEVHRGSDQ